MMNNNETKNLRLRLYKAIENKKSTLRQIIRLIAEGALIKLENEQDFCSPLFVAAQAGRADIVRLLLDAGADVVDFVEDGWCCDGPHTALSVAALRGHTHVVQALIKAAEADKKRPDLEGALRSAVYAGNADIIRLLLDAGAEVDGPRMLIWSRLQKQLQLPRKDLPVSFMSMALHADRQDTIKLWRWCRVRQRRDESPLSLAIKTERRDIIDMLLDAGADINYIAHEHDSPLGLAARIGNTELMQHLIDRGANVNGAKAVLHTPLIAAAREGCVESVRFLLDHGADVNAGTASCTPLTAAARYAKEQFVPVARILLEAGADVNAVAGLYTPLTAAVNAECIDGTRLLLDAGADVNKAIGRNTPLIIAAETGNTELVRLLLDAGADVNKASKATTPLIAAASIGGNAQTVKLLLDAGADVNRASEDATPLIAAAFNHGNVQTVKLLLKAGADVNAEADGQTALSVAVARVDLPLAHCLRRAGAINKQEKIL